MHSVQQTDAAGTVNATCTDAKGTFTQPQPMQSVLYPKNPSEDSFLRHE